MSSSTVQQRRRKPRVVYTQQEVNILESEFIACKDPDNNERLRIANDLRKDAEEIKTWFKNRRSRGKPAKPSSIVSPKCNQVQNIMISREKYDVPNGNEMHVSLNVLGKNKRARKERFVFSKEQVKGLEEAFRQHPNPEHWQKDEIAVKWNLTTAIVTNWFKNRRTKAKKTYGKENSAPPPPPPPQPTIAYQPLISFDQYPPVAYQQPPPPTQPPIAYQPAISMDPQPPTIPEPPTSTYQPSLPLSPPMESNDEQSISFESLFFYQPLMPIESESNESHIPIELEPSPTSTSPFEDFTTSLIDYINNYNDV
uniref:Homeobox domain-containing protein n=1 Tax=Tetranychus urticae TaxID=32264 RepID=T1KMS0_TETUR